MPEVADITLGGKYQRELLEAMNDEFKNSVTFYLSVINQDGFLPTTEPPRDKAQELLEGLPRFQQLRQESRARLLTVREQQFLMRQMELRRNGHAE